MAFELPQEQQTGLQKIGRGLAAFGAGVQGRGQQFLAGQQQQQQALSLERKQALVEDLRRAKMMLDKGDIAGVRGLAQERAGLIQQLGGDPKETIELLGLAEGAIMGDQTSLDRLNTEINSGLQSAADAGLIKLPQAPQPLSPEGKLQADIRAGFVQPQTAVQKFQDVVDASGNVVAQENTETGQIISNPVAVARIAQEKEAAEQTVATKEAEIRTQGNIQNIDDTIAITNRLVGTDEEGRRIEHEGLAGAVGFKLGESLIPGTKASDFAAIVDTLKARLGFDELARMRANSPTGGALGQVTERELAFLQAAVQSLDLSQSEEQFKENLGLIRESLGRFRSAQEQFLSQKEETSQLPQGMVDNGDGTFTLPNGVIVERE